MKLKALFSLMLGALALTASAQMGGYQDGVDNYNAGRFDVAQAILDNTLNHQGTDKAVSYFYLGNLAIRSNHLDAAKKNFEAGIAADPKYGYNYIGLGELALMAGNKKEAENQFKLGTKTNGKDMALVAAVARAYYNVNPELYAKEIAKQIETGLKKSKNTEPAIYILQGDMIAKINPGEAAGKYEMAIMQADQLGQVNREAYVKYANTYFKVNPAFAIDRLKELNQKEPNSALAQRELAEKYYDNEQFGSACLQYEKYLQNPNHFQKDEQRYAGLLFSAKRYDESLAMAKQVLAKDPNNHYMHRVILLNKAALENWPLAVEAGKKLFGVEGASLVPNDYILYGNALSQTGDAVTAVAIFEKAIELNPDKPDLLTELSAVYDRAGKKEEAVETMKKYLDLGNGSVTDLLSMGRRLQSLALSYQGTADSTKFQPTIQEAVKFANLAIEKAGDSLTPGSLASLWRAKGGMLLVGNDSRPNDAVVEAYSKVIENVNLEEDKTRFYPYLGEAYRVIGAYHMINNNNAQAKEVFSKFLEIYPDDAAMKEVVDRLSALEKE